MKRTFLKLALVGLAAAVLGGCASGVKYQEMASGIPSLKPGQGRIYFFRSASMFGAALTPEIRLNNQVVGYSKPGGFFFVDRPAGNYTAAASTETEKTASFTLQPGETKYLRTYTTIGVIVGRVVVELEDPKKALTELPSLAYTGNDNIVSNK